MVSERKDHFADRDSYDPRPHVLATKGEAAAIPGLSIDQALKRLNEHVVELSERSIVEAQENCILDVSRTFIRRLLLDALCDLLSSILQDDAGIREAFETVVVHVKRESAQSQAEEVSRLVVSDSSVLAQIGIFLVEMAKTAIARVFKIRISAVPPSSPPSGPKRSSLSLEEHLEKKIRSRQGNRVTNETIPKRRQVLIPCQQPNRSRTVKSVPCKFRL